MRPINCKLFQYCKKKYVQKMKTIRSIQKIWKDYYIINKLYDCEAKKFDDLNFVSCFHGGLFLKINHESLEIISNTGHILLSTYLNVKNDIHSVFWCQGSNIAILYKNGDIDVLSILGEKVTTFKATDESGVNCASSFFNGASVITNQCYLCIFDFSLMKYQAYTKLDLHKEITSFAFHKGMKTEGYISFNDGTIISISDKGIQQIAALPFVAKKIIISPLI